jgi:hypothetical protein
MLDRRNDTILLATDLDRTLLPNGDQPESPNARLYFRRLAARPEVTLVYVTGRHRLLVERAMAEYDLPRPQYVIGDVGASMYAVRDHDWQLVQDWQQTLAPDWAGYGHGDLAGALAGVSGLRLQEPSKQAHFKLSYYAPAFDDPSALLAEVCKRLAATRARSNVIWSVDETTSTGLLDILPARAGKLHALEFLRKRLGVPLERTVFAGDSGNDLEVMESAIPAVLVANAQTSVRSNAMARARKAGNSAALYLAWGALPGLNGNYSAGILEGVTHFIPGSRHWLEL